eukprot:1158016-Pelagomonas_calceolata.AAC.3
MIKVTKVTGHMSSASLIPVQYQQLSKYPLLTLILTSPHPCGTKPSEHECQPSLPELLASPGESAGSLTNNTCIQCIVLDVSHADTTKQKAKKQTHNGAALTSTPSQCGSWAACLALLAANADCHMEQPTQICLAL